MGVAVREPQAGVSGRGADHRARIRETGPAAHPRGRFDRLPEREQPLRRRQQPVELHRRRRRIARGEFGARGQPDALLHRRQAIADLGVDHRPRQRGIAGAAVVAVIAALDPERQLDPERLEQIRRKRPKRHHRRRGLERAFRRLDPPMSVGAGERARIAAYHYPAERGKARRQGLGHRERVGHAGDAPPVHRVAKDRRQGGLELARALGLECAIGNAEFLRQRELALERREGAVAAVELQPALLAQIARGAGIGEQHLVLGERAREQRAHDACGLDQPRPARGGAELDEPGRDLRQEGEVVIGLGRALERDAQQGRPIGRKGGRKDRIAFDHAGIAVGGLLARPAAVDERRRQTALGELEPDRGADDAGPEHDGVDARHGLFLPRRLRRPQAAPSRDQYRPIYGWAIAAAAGRSTRFPRA